MTVPKKPWRKPEIKTIKAGAAENLSATKPDPASGGAKS
jgi:hypothetical protein